MDALKQEIAEQKIELNKKFDQFTKIIALTAENTELELTGQIIKTVTLAFDKEIVSLKNEVAELRELVDAMEKSEPE